MAEHLINGKKVTDGQLVHYTDSTGQKHKAQVKKVNAVYTADLQANIDGADRYMENVPFSEDGGHSWQHIPDGELDTSGDDTSDLPSDSHSTKARTNRA